MRTGCVCLEVFYVSADHLLSFSSILRNMAAAAHTRLLRLGRQLQAASSGTAASLTRVKSIASVSSPDQFGTGETNDLSCDSSSSSSSTGGPSYSPKESQRRVTGSTRGREGRDGIEATKNNSPLPISLASFSSDALFSLTENNGSLSSFSLSPSKRNAATHIALIDGGVHTPENRLKQQTQHQSSFTPVSKCIDSPNTTSLHVRHSDAVPAISPSNSSFLFHPSSRRKSVSSLAKSPTLFSSSFSSRSYSSSSSSSSPYLKTASNSSLPGPGAVWGSDLLVEHCDNKSTDDSGKNSGCVVLKLNRPEKLNALSLDVITALRWIIPSLEADPRCSFLCLTGQGPKAFCAGGDVRSLVRAPLLQVQQFFGQEYSLIYTISQMAKPYIALWNGISMGQSLSLPSLSMYVHT